MKEGHDDQGVEEHGQSAGGDDHTRSGVAVRLALQKSVFLQTRQVFSDEHAF